MSSSPSRPVRYLALISLKPGQRDRLRHYANQVLPVFRRHGGAFETAAGLEAVRRDPEMQAVVPLRQELVRKALLLRIEDMPLGTYFSSRA